MQLRRDPITQSWVNLEDEGDTLARPQDAPCPLCPGHESFSSQTLYEYPGGGSTWRVRGGIMRVVQLGSQSAQRFCPGGGAGCEH